MWHKYPIGHSRNEAIARFGKGGGHALLLRSEWGASASIAARIPICSLTTLRHMITADPLTIEKLTA
jgi:hypothetical protein